jgi:hypothetical protein
MRDTYRENYSRARRGASAAACLMTLTLTAATSTALAAQGGIEAPSPIEPVIVSGQGIQRVQVFGGPAYEVLQEFREVLNQYPPTLRDILRRDPTLMLDENFLSPYPALAAFLTEHPEVVHDPNYFLGSVRGNDITEAVSIAIVFLTIAGTLIWLVKTGIEHRRWSRASNVQAEVQTKLLDRFSGSQDLLAYLETPAGRRFLESAPIQQSGAQMPGSPLNRVFWSLQTGLVLAIGGWGLRYAIPRLADPGAADPLYVVGTLAIALGIGFVLSAVVSLALSHSLGLVRPVATDRSEPAQPGSRE